MPYLSLKKDTQVSEYNIYDNFESGSEEESKAESNRKKKLKIIPKKKNQNRISIESGIDPQIMNKIKNANFN